MEKGGDIRSLVASRYSLLELFFGEYMWVRKFSKGYWVNSKEPGTRWVKLNPIGLRDAGICYDNNPNYLVEDYRLNVFNGLGSK